MKKSDCIAKDYKSGEFSIDAIVGRHIGKGFDKDDVLKVIRDTRWDHYKKTGVKL